MNRKRLVVAATAVTALAGGTLGAYADSSTVPVTTVVGGAGARTLNVTDPTGASIGNSGLPLGAGHGGAFLVNVTDVNYKHAGYQVSATMTNLYPYANGNYDFSSSPIPSSAVSVSYPGGLLDLLNVKSLVAPVVQLTGTLDLGLLGSAVNVDQTMDGATTSVQNLADTITKDTLSSVVSDLPVTLQTGDTGAFSNPAGLPGESGSFTPTSKVLMQGSAQSATTGLLSALNSTYGGQTAQQLADAGLIDQNAVVSLVAQQLGVTPDLLTAGQITTIMTTLTGTITGLTGDLVGQSGAYNTMPVLNLSLPSSQAPGVYRGQMVVTLMDTP